MSADAIFPSSWGMNENISPVFPNSLPGSDDTGQGSYYGGEVRGMKYVSPLVIQKLFYQTSNDIFSKYFPDSKNVQKGNTNVIKDFNVKRVEYDYYFDSNHSGIFGDQGDILAFKLLLFVSDDGNKIKECYEVIKPADDEIILFLESDNDNLSDDVLYAKMSEKVRKRFTDKNGNVSPSLYSNELVETVKKFAPINQAILEELIQKGHIEGSKIAEGFFTLLKYTLLGLLSPSKALGWVLNKLGDGIDYLKIPDKIWDVENDEYYFQKDKIKILLSIPTDPSKIRDLFTVRSGYDLAAQMPKMLDDIIAKQVNIFSGLTGSYNDYIDKEIDNLFKGLRDNEDAIAAIQKWVAYQCGIWNGLVDFISSVCKFFGSLLEVNFNVWSDIQHTLELIDNFWALLWDGTLYKNMSEAIAKGIEELEKYLKSKNADDIDWVRVSYITGFTLAFIATFFIPIADIAKIGEVGKVGEILAKLNTEVGQTLSKAAKITKIKTAEAYQKVSRALEELLVLIKAGGQKLYELIEQLWKKIAEWFLKNRKLLSKVEELINLGLSKETAEIFNRLSLKVKKISSIVLASGTPIGRNKFAVFHKGVQIFEGTANDLSKFGKKIKSLGEEAATKYLDDLLEKTFIIGERFLEHIEQGHVVIEIVNSRISKFVIQNGKKVRNIDYVAEEYSYLAGKGRSSSAIRPPYQVSVKSVGGFHILSKLNNRLVRIVENVATKILPTGETVRLAKIEYWVEELGQWYAKVETHTFFPSKWNLEKISKIVLEASKNITFKQGNKFRGITKTGIEIEFYINPKTKEITTAYIYFK